MNRQKLIQIVPIDKIPEKLSFISEGITTVLDRVYFEKFIFNKTKYGEAGAGNITIVFDEKVGFDFGNSGFSLVFNPNSISGTELNISLSYRWEIIKYIKLFSSNPDSLNALDYFNIISNMFGISDEMIIEYLITSFLTSTNKVDEFVTNVNTNIYFPINTPLGGAIILK
jgi:hypothetical protein